MADFIESILFILAVVIFVILLPLMWLARLRRVRRLKEQEQKARFEHRQLRPDFAAFASHYGCQPPQALRRLYEDRQNVLDANFEVHLPSSREAWPVAWFEPMEEGEWIDMAGSYSFANDGCGNLYLVSVRDDDPEVAFLDHETGKREALGVRLSQFLAAKRTR